MDERDQEAAAALKEQYNQAVKNILAKIEYLLDKYPNMRIGAVLKDGNFIVNLREIKLSISLKTEI